MFNFITRNFPAVVFLGIWTISLLMYKFNPYNYFLIANSTANIIFIAIISALLGFLISTLYLNKGRFLLYKEEKRTTKIEFNISVLKKLMFVLCLGALFGILWILFILSSHSGGIIQYLSNPILARQIVVESSGKISTGWNIAHSLANYLVNFNYFAVLIGGIIFQSERGKIVSFIPLTTALLISIITFQRYFFVYNFVLWWSTLIVISNLLDSQSKLLFKKRILRVGLIIAVIFIAFSFILISVRVSFGHKSVNIANIGEKIVESNYTYLAGNVVALDNYFKGDIKLYYGSSTFRDPLKWMVRFGLWEEMDLVGKRKEFSSIGPTNFNTYTYIRRFYEDFGIFGVCILSFLWVILCNYLFFSIKKNFSLLRLYFVTVAIFSLFMSFYDFALTNLMLFIYMATVIFVIEHLFLKPKYLYWFRDASFIKKLKT